MGSAVMPVEFPAMRGYVVDALAALADPVRQERDWGRFDESANRYDDLSLNVHLLYDDCGVLPDPAGAVGAMLYREEVAPLKRLGVLLDALIDDLGESTDAVYLSDSRWPEVVEAARLALSSMRA